MFYDIVQVIPYDDYTVYVYFEDGKIVCYNAKPLLDKPVFAPLKDINILASKYDIELLTTMHSNDIIERVKDGESFDLILLEDDMRPLSGFSTLGNLKKVNEKFNVPTIIILEKNKESIKEHYVEDGFSDYIRKQNLEEDYGKVIKKYI